MSGDPQKSAKIVLGRKEMSPGILMTMVRGIDLPIMNTVTASRTMGLNNRQSSVKTSINKEEANSLATFILEL